MAARRLSDNNKKELVDRFRSGETAAILADSFGCSPNTVTRVVRAVLSESEYSALKVSRSTGTSFIRKSNSTKKTSQPPVDEGSSDPKDENCSLRLPLGHQRKEDELVFNGEDSSLLALEDADDFAEETTQDEDLPVDSIRDDLNANVFQELVPLIEGVEIRDRNELLPKPFTTGMLPGSVYMLVDKSIELDSRPLKDFPELGTLSQIDQERKAIFLFENPRSAKRECGRSQRVIRVPDTTVFKITLPYLLARGVTCLVLDGTLISLDSPEG